MAQLRRTDHRRRREWQEDEHGRAVGSVAAHLEAASHRFGEPAGEWKAQPHTEHWEIEDWSRLWWMHADLRHIPDPSPSLTGDLAARLARAVPQYVDRPFHRVLVCRTVAETGWSAAES